MSVPAGPGGRGTTDAHRIAVGVSSSRKADDGRAPGDRRSCMSLQRHRGSRVRDRDLRGAMLDQVGSRATGGPGADVLTSGRNAIEMSVTRE